MGRTQVLSLIVAIVALAAPRPAFAQAAPAPPVAPKGPAPDPDRTAALVASSIGFGVGAAATGAIYVYQFIQDDDRCRAGESTVCNHPSARASLVGYGAIVTIVPSLPRFVVGDTARGLIFSSLRGIAVVVAEFAPWGDDTETRWQGPFLLGFAAPIALGIVDLATTPHREDLAPQVAGIRTFAPIPLADGRSGAHGALFALTGVF